MLEYQFAHPLRPIKCLNCCILFLHHLWWRNINFVSADEFYNEKEKKNRRKIALATEEKPQWNIADYYIIQFIGIEFQECCNLMISAWTREVNLFHSINQEIYGRDKYLPYVILVLQDKKTLHRIGHWTFNRIDSLCHWIKIDSFRNCNSHIPMR